MTYEKIMHILLHMTKPINVHLSLRLTRKSQDMLFKPTLKAFGVNPIYSDMETETDSFFAYPPENVSDEYIGVYMHGGAYCAGGVPYTRGIAGMLACKLSMCVIGCVYRLAPEHPYPDGLTDVFECYKTAVKTGKKIVLIGESAGGGMAFALCKKIQEKNMTMPYAIIAFSPWTDLTFSGESFHFNKHKDPSIGIKQLKKSASLYLNGTRAENPLVSPIFLDTDGFPRTIIYVGGDEILLSDAQKIHKNLLAHGVESEIHVHEKMWHVYPLFHTCYDEEIFGRIREWIYD